MQGLASGAEIKSVVGLADSSIVGGLGAVCLLFVRRSPAFFTRGVWAWVARAPLLLRESIMTGG